MTMAIARWVARRRCTCGNVAEMVLALPGRTTNSTSSVMKYVLLVHESAEALNRPVAPEAIAAGRAYGQALYAAGVFVACVCLDSLQSGTTVTQRDGKRHVQDGPSAETKEFLAGFAVSD